MGSDDSPKHLRELIQKTFLSTIEKVGAAEACKDLGSRLLSSSSESGLKNLDTLEQELKALQSLTEVCLKRIEVTRQRLQEGDE